MNQYSTKQLIDNQLLTVNQLAEYLNVKPATIRDWVFKRRIPFIKVGWSVRFKRPQIEGWLSERSHHVD